MRIFCLSILLGLVSVSSAFGQRDAPVWESYLPMVSIYHDEIDKRDAVTVNFLFKKNGGPYEHSEHQAYILVYLEKDEPEVLQLAADPQLTKKQDQNARRFLEILIDKKLVVTLESRVAKLNSPNGRTPQFADVSGYPRRAGINTLTDFSFPFKFSFTYEALFHAVQQLGNFRSDNLADGGSTKWFPDKFKLIVFVPVNDSGYATKVSSKLRTTWDFANGPDSSTAILYFRPLPYEFSMAKFKEKTLLLYIN